MKTKRSYPKKANSYLKVERRPGAHRRNACRSQNIFTQYELDILTNDAKKHKSDQELAYHGDDSSKRFCFNAIFKEDNDNQKSITNCQSLFSSITWDSLDNDVKKVVIKGITKAVSYHQSLMIGRESQESQENQESQRFVCFELIYIPFKGPGKKIIPGLPWHSDEGYDRNDEPFCYADTTTVFMLTDPSNWSGANLQLRDLRDIKDTKNSKFVTHKYSYNNAVTFINKGTEHRVTQLRPLNRDGARIVLIVSVYGSDETKTYLNS